MPVLLQINTALGVGSVGTLVSRIAAAAAADGWRSVAAHGARYVRGPLGDGVESVQIGTCAGEWLHVAATRLFDRHGLASRTATRRLIGRIRSDIRPDIIHLHNLHGYYLNYPELFDYLIGTEVPVVWTLHDCWPFTGHCGFYDAARCDRWRTADCSGCPVRRAYPKAWRSRAEANFRLKRRLFAALGDRLTLVTPSRWLAAEVGRSFLRGVRVVTIANGVDLSVFRPSVTTEPRTVLGVAAPWTAYKGLDDFVELRRLLPSDYRVTMVGLTRAQARRMPRGIRGLRHVDHAADLAREYSRSSVYVNLTYQDNYPTVNIEAMACGTPVVTYDAGGSGEAVTAGTGAVVRPGDVSAAAAAVQAIAGGDTAAWGAQCRSRAEKCFGIGRCTSAYLELFKKILF